MNILKYKEYEGTAEIDMDRHVCRGKILFISDLITYEASEPAKLQKEFEDAVDDYLETCKLLGREAKKPLKGQFNVRIAPELHKKATVRAYEINASLNDVVIRSLEMYLQSDVKTDDVKVALTIPPEAFLQYMMSLSQPPKFIEGMVYAR